MTTKKYWCPTCGYLTSTDFAGIADLVPHREHCQTLTEIPVFDPLAVPEVTTLDESDLADGMVVSLIGYRSGVFRVCTPDTRTYDGNHWCASERHTAEITVTAINYVAGVRK
jgi:hypothetical protein